MKVFWETETRGRAFVDSELRIKGSSRIVGHAAVFNQLSEDLGGFREQIRPGAFSETIKHGDIRALFNHDTNKILGRTKAGTLKLSEDEIGLATEYDFPDTSYARDLLISIKRGDVSHQSFGFSVLPDGEERHREAGGFIRDLITVELFDVSPVVFPAYRQTDISSRALDAEVRSRMQAQMEKEPGEKEPDKEEPEPEEKPESEIVIPRIASASMSYAERIHRARVVMSNGGTEEERAKRELEQRRATREWFISQRLPKPNPFSYAEILKKSRHNDD